MIPNTFSVCYWDKHGIKQEFVLFFGSFIHWFIITITFNISFYFNGFQWCVLSSECERTPVLQNGCRGRWNAVQKQFINKWTPTTFLKDARKYRKKIKLKIVRDKCWLVPSREIHDQIILQSNWMKYLTDNT